MDSDSTQESTKNSGDLSNPGNKRQRAIFPWVVVALAAIPLFGGSFFGWDEDFSVFIWFFTIPLASILIGLWYLLRGKSPLWWRLPIGLCPLAFCVLFPMLFECEYDGNVRIVGIQWRGQANPDELLEPLAAASVAFNQAADIDIMPHDYPGFLGTEYWAERKGIELGTDWKSNPPQQIWRKPIGAGWSSFAMVGLYAYTQEQRGPNEMIVCYEAETGKVIWTHEDATRFDPEGIIQSMGGRGPRATPTVSKDSNGKAVVITHGTSGLIHCLDAHTGAERWTVDAEKAFGCVPLTWGNSSSPLCIAATESNQPMAVIAVGAPKDSSQGEYDSSLVAFDLTTGEVLWQAGWRETAYATPIVTKLHGVRTIVQVNQDMITAHALTDGKVLWEHPFPGRSDADASSTQAIPIGNNQILLSKAYGYGASLIQINHTKGEWTTEPVWSPAVSKVLKTKLSNVVIRDGYAYGLSTGVLQCVDLATGKSQWIKRRRPKIGHGQLILVGKHLLITSESGELILLRPNPEQYEELAAIPILSDEAICWSTPALRGDLLLVRNSEEAVAYRLPLEMPKPELAAPEFSAL